MNMIHQVEWAVRLSVAAAAGQEAHSETRKFWLEEGAKPEHFYNKRKGPLDTVVACGLTGKTRDISVEEVEAHSGENWKLAGTSTAPDRHCHTAADGECVSEDPRCMHQPVAPMVVLIHPGQTVVVRVADSDGEFAIHYGKDRLTVGADMPDATGREGIIYEEKFGPSETDDVKEEDFTAGRF